MARLGFFALLVLLAGAAAASSSAARVRYSEVVKLSPRRAYASGARRWSPPSTAETG